MTATIDFRSPEAGYDDPVAMWLACHQRVKRFSALLGRLSAHLAQTGADDEAQRAAASIRRYFNEAAPRHHEDEEEDLFPLLRERAAGDGAALAAMDRIEAEHLELATLWREVDALLERVCAGEPVAIAPELAARFAAAYDRHIDIEEGVILTALRRALLPADWQQVGRSMAGRRGLEWDAPAPAAGPKSA